MTSARPNRPEPLRHRHEPELTLDEGRHLSDQATRQGWHLNHSASPRERHRRRGGLHPLPADRGAAGRAPSAFLKTMAAIRCAPSGRGRCRPFTSIQAPRRHASRSSSVVRTTGIAFGGAPRVGGEALALVPGDRSTRRAARSSFRCTPPSRRTCATCRDRCLPRRGCR